MKTTSLLFAALTLLSATAIHAADCCAPAVPDSCCAAAGPIKAVKLTDKSIYQLDSTWTNDASQATKLSSLKGRPQVVTMFFANCQYACPLLVYQVKQIEAALSEKIRDQIGFTLVSFDSERDTPEALRNYRLQQNLGEHWKLLRGEPDNVLELAAVLGVKFKKDAQGQFMHSNIITVLNTEGEIVYQQTGLSANTAEAVRQIEKLLK